MNHFQVVFLYRLVDDTKLLMGDEEFVDVRYEGFSHTSGLSSRDSFVMEPAESSPIVNNTDIVNTEKDMDVDKGNPPLPEKETSSQDLGKEEEPETLEDSEQEKPTSTKNQPNAQSWSSWGSAFMTAASSSVKALEHGMAKVLDVIEDDGGKGDASSPVKQEGTKSSSPQGGEGDEFVLPPGMKDDLRTISSAMQRTSGKMLSSGFGVLSAIGKRTMEVLVADDEGDLPTTDFSLSARIREAHAVALEHEKEQLQQLAYWFDKCGGNDSFEAFRCFSQSSLHSIHGKIDAKETSSEEEVIPETYRQIAELFSASSDRLIKEWDSPEFVTSVEEGDLLDGDQLASVLKEKLSELKGSSEKLVAALKKSKCDLLSEESKKDQLLESSLECMAMFTTAAIDNLHKSAQLLHASALSAKQGKKPKSNSAIRSTCAHALEEAAAFSTACLVFAKRIRAISLAGRSAIQKNDQMNEEDKEMALRTLQMEATDCAAHLARLLGFLGPVLQHLLLLRAYGADCCPEKKEGEQQQHGKKMKNEEEEDGEEKKK